VGWREVEVGGDIGTFTAVKYGIYLKNVKINTI